MGKYNIKGMLRESLITKHLYAQLKIAKIRNDNAKKFFYHGQFIKRIKGSNKACIILAGYKEFFYPALFGRIEKYAPRDMDICVVSSGRFSETLDQLCERNGWSYLSTQENNVALVQNVAIRELKDAKYIFKLDEDILITEGYFEKMLQAYEHSKNECDFIPGVMAPLIPVNGYGHMRILEKLGLREEYSRHFEYPLYAAGVDRQIEQNPEAAVFFWGEGGLIPDIDTLNQKFGQDGHEERACPIRFNIGAILFERAFFEKFGYFTVDRSYSQLGNDEAQLCAYCLLASRPLMVSENIVVGHLSFGPQNQRMKEYFEEHPQLFLP